MNIRDAMVLVRSLGYSYLWVDALYIAQDDATEMSDQIKAMSWVYSELHWTLHTSPKLVADHGRHGHVYHHCCHWFGRKCQPS